MNAFDRIAIIDAWLAIPGAIAKHERRAHANLIAYEYSMVYDSTTTTGRVLTGQKRRPCISCRRGFKSTEHSRICPECHRKNAKFGKSAERVYR